MKLYFIKSALLIFLLLTTVKATATVHKSPVTSKEEVSYTARQEDEILFITKSADFVGTFERTYEPNPELQIVDLYAFPNVSLKMNPASCVKLAHRIVGPARAKLQVGKPSVFVSHSGKACEIKVEDLSQDAKFPERRIIIGTLKTKAYAIIFKFQHKPSAETDAGPRLFWRTLR